MAVRHLPTAAPHLLDRPRRWWRHLQTTSRPVRARVGYAGGVAMAAWGVGVQFGFGWALMAGGLVTAGSFLLLYPVDG